MWYDALSVVVILVFAWKGAARGAIWQLAVIGSVGLCILLAGHLTPEIEPHIPLEEPLRHWAAVGIVYLGLSLVVFLAARQLRGWIEKAEFVEYDRHWGAILGLSKGIALMLVVTCLLAVLAPSSRTMLRKSYTGYSARIGVEYAAPLLPAKVSIGLIQALDEPPLSPLPVLSPLRLPEPLELTL
jgi:uncharacterized membrane protein required for colicin V production